MKFEDTIRQIERVDQLIRLKATGTPKELAARLELSESACYELLNLMKRLGAPVMYCRSRKCYYYEENVQFNFGFILSDEQNRQIEGGTTNVKVFSLRDFWSERGYF